MHDEAMTKHGSAEQRERRAAAWAHGVFALLQRRPDLAGVYVPADFTAEAVRWSA